TKRFWWAVVAGIPLAAFAYQAGQPYFLIAYDLLLLVVALTTLRLSPSPGSLKLRRKFDPVLSVRAANKITVELENEGLEPIKGRVREEPPVGCTASRQEFGISIRPESVVEVEYFLTPSERGSDYFRGTYLRMECPLGLVERQVKLNTEQPVRIYPNVLAL